MSTLCGFLYVLDLLFDLHAKYSNFICILHNNLILFVLLHPLEAAGQAEGGPDSTRMPTVCVSKRGEREAVESTLKPAAIIVCSLANGTSVRSIDCIERVGVTNWAQCIVRAFGGHLVLGTPTTRPFNIMHVHVCVCVCACGQLLFWTFYSDGLLAIYFGHLPCSRALPRVHALKGSNQIYM